ncbi:MAG: DUF1501 domain-containing protein, partial [Planctomyces sp.]
MLTILGQSPASQTRRTGFCDGISRRNFLTIGGMALGGVSLADGLRADEQQKSGRSHKAIINIYRPGGPPHLDMWDPKPEAPAEIRGEFSAIPTSVPGIYVSELFPRMAQLMDKFVLVRSLSDSDGGHDAYQCMTGRRKGSRQPPGGWPSGGAWVSRMAGQVTPAIPANVALMYNTGNRTWGEPGGGGFLGVAHAPFNLVGREARSKPENMTLNGITLEKLQDRTALMKSLDRFRRDADQRRQMESLDVYAQQAMGILTTSKLVDALDLSKEDPRVVASYGASSEAFQRDGAPPMVENFCVARRLVEAGARFVSLN